MGLETGEGRQEFGLKFQEELNHYINKYIGEGEVFYLLHMVKTIKHLIYYEFKGTWIKLTQTGYDKIMKQTGGRGLVSSLCYKIEPKGRVSRCWVLPPDTPSPSGISYEEAYSDEIIKSAKGIPIAHG